MCACPASALASTSPNLHTCDCTPNNTCAQKPPQPSAEVAQAMAPRAAPAVPLRPVLMMHPGLAGAMAGAVVQPLRPVPVKGVPPAAAGRPPGLQGPLPFPGSPAARLAPLPMPMRPAGSPAAPVRPVPISAVRPTAGMGPLLPTALAAALASAEQCRQRRP